MAEPGKPKNIDPYRQGGGDVEASAARCRGPYFPLDFRNVYDAPRYCFTNDRRVTNSSMNRRGRFTRTLDDANVSNTCSPFYSYEIPAARKLVGPNFLFPNRRPNGRHDTTREMAFIHLVAIFGKDMEIF